MKWRPTRRTLKKATPRTMITAKFAVIVWVVPIRQERTVRTTSPAQMARTLGLMAPRRSLTISVSQVEKRKENEPQEVDQMPVARTPLNERQASRSQIALASEHEQVRQHAHAQKEV